MGVSSLTITPSDPLAEFLLPVLISMLRWLKSPTSEGRNAPPGETTVSPLN